MDPCIRPQEASSSVVSELQLAAHPSELAVARRYAEDAAISFGLDRNGCYDFAFAVNEAVTNAIRHGAPDEHGNIRLSVAVEHERLIFSVRDSGNFTVPEHRPDDCSENGRGLALMATLMDEVTLSIGYRSTTLSLAKMHPEPAANRRPLHLVAPVTEAG